VGVEFNQRQVLFLFVFKYEKCQSFVTEEKIKFVTLLRNIIRLLTSIPRYKIRGPLEKFVDSPYYSESEICGGAVTVSFSKHLPWQAMHFLHHSTHFSKTCYRPMITSKFLASEFPFYGRKSLVRSASLAKGGTSKKRPSPHLHKVPTRSNKVSPRTLLTALVICLAEHSRKCNST
jgi:hypothetical protein